MKEQRMYLNVSLAIDIHVDERAEPNQTLPHFHILPPLKQRGSYILKAALMYHVVYLGLCVHLTMKPRHWAWNLMILLRKST